MAQKQKGVADAMIEADEWTSEGASSSYPDVLWLPHVWTTANRLRGYNITSGILTVSVFTTAIRWHLASPVYCHQTTCDHTEVRPA